MNVKEASFYTKENKHVQCNLCRHNCIIPEGKTGICGVRKNIEGKLYTLTYPKPTALHVDPIEKKPLFHFLPFTEVFSIGSFGCNFKCKFCQNWDISQVVLENIRDVPPNEVIKMVHTPSIAYTYNEPTVFYEYAYEIATLANKKGIKNIFVTNGYIEEEPLKKIEPILDAANIDFKAYSKEFYSKLVGASFDKFLESLKVWAKTKIWIEFTNLIITDENDKPDQIKAMCEFIKDKFGDQTPLHFTAYYPSFQLRNPPTPPSTLEKAYSIAKDVGLKYVYLGNIPSDKINTYCYNCGELLVDRINRKLYLTDDKRCPSCGKKQWFVL